MDTPPNIDYPLTTYRYVRICLVAVVGALAASVVLTAVPESCWQTSISAFYFTLTHAVFIGALCATGICLIAYKGMTSSEDTLLNYSGFLAFVVALVPTQSPTSNPHEASASVCGLWLPTYDPVSDPTHAPALAVTNNISAVLIGAVIGLLVFLVVRANAAPAPKALSLDEESAENRSTVARISRFILKWSQVVVPLLVVVTLVAGVVWFFVDRPSFSDNAHGAAAIAMFGGIVAVVVLHACYSAQHWCRCDSRGRFTFWYIVIAVVMLGTLIAVTVLHLRLPTWNHWVLALEAVMILQFAVFWVLQSIDLWNGPYRLRVPKVTLPGLHQDAGDKAALG